MFAPRATAKPRADKVDTQRFLRKWTHLVERDPYYNVNLTRQGVQCQRA
jgi:hypothetical protein